MCEECAKKRYGAAMSNASKCGHQATRIGMKWCVKCAAMKGVCQACGKALPKKTSR
ncbi:MAG: hypothetical protein RL272_561 [Candidatus Parcubacteria bacterium]